MTSIFEQLGGTYTLGSDGMLYPNLTLGRNLADAEERAQAMLEQLIRRIAMQKGITESLKAADQMEWIRRMNSVRSRAEEIVREQIITTTSYSALQAWTASRNTGM